MNGYLFALIQAFIYFVVLGVDTVIRGDLVTIDIGALVIAGLVYFLGICVGVYYMSPRGGKV